MTKTPRSSSYLHKIACQYDRHIPFLKPPRTLARHWGTMQPHDQAAETVRLISQSPVETGTIPLLQASPALSPQHAVEQPSTHYPIRKAAFSSIEAKEVTSLSSPSTQPSRFHAPVTLPDSSPVLGIRELPSQAEVQLTPAKSTHSVAAETSRPANVAQISSDRQTRTSGREQPARVTLRPQSQQQEAPSLTSTNSRHTADFLGWENKTSARENRLAALPHKQEKQQHAAIHIGTIEVHIVPPAPTVPLPPARSTTVRSRSTSTLSREMMSLIGLRQG